MLVAFFLPHLENNHGTNSSSSMSSSRWRRIPCRIQSIQQITKTSKKNTDIHQIWPWHICFCSLIESTTWSKKHQTLPDPFLGKNVIGMNKIGHSRQTWVPKKFINQISKCPSQIPASKECFTPNTEIEWKFKEEEDRITDAGSIRSRSTLNTSGATKHDESRTVGLGGGHRSQSMRTSRPRIVVASVPSRFQFRVGRRWDQPRLLRLHRQSNSSPCRFLLEKP